MKVDEITVDDHLNVSRPEGLDTQLVLDYAESIQNGSKFPPVTIFNDQQHNWLSSGFHRLAATKQAGLKEIEVEIRSGSKEDAIKSACGDNAKHGKSRTNQGKRAQVKKMLELESEWSDRQIARWCQVTHPFVSNVRSHTGNVTSINQERTFIHHKTGQPTTMKTASIGRSQAARQTNLPAEVVQVLQEFEIPIDQWNNEVICPESETGTRLVAPLFTERVIKATNQMKAELKKGPVKNVIVFNLLLKNSLAKERSSTIDENLRLN